MLAVEAIRKQILFDELKPGERLIEERLTKDLGISRPPLREALRLLENEGLVVSRPRRGSFVATLTNQDVYEILTLRSALERMAFELGIPVKDPALLEPARAALQGMYRCALGEPAATKAVSDLGASPIERRPLAGLVVGAWLRSAGRPPS